MVWAGFEVGFGITVKNCFRFAHPPRPANRLFMLGVFFAPKIAHETRLLWQASWGEAEDTNMNEKDVLKRLTMD